MTTLPYEIWEQIFHELIDPVDISACYNSCSTFRQILTGNRVQFLFQDVLPHLKHHLEKADVLNCRQVCRRWNSAVNTSLQNPDHLVKHGQIQVTTRQHWEKWLRKLYCFEWVDDIETFLALMKNHGQNSNPFLTRTVRLSFIHQDHRDEVRYWFKAGSLIERFGKHIRHLEVLHYNTIDPDSASLFYENVLLNWTSNEALNELQSLELNCVCKDTEAIETLIRDKPLPKLGHLEHLSVSETQSKVSREVLRAWGNGGTLKHLHVSYFDDFEQGFVHNYSDVEDKFEGLQSLDVPMPRLDSFIIMTSIQSKFWSLKKLVLQKVVLLFCEYGGSPLTFPLLFRALNMSSFAKTLKELTLHLRGFAVLDEAKENVRLRLPELEILTISGKYKFPRIASMHFALELKSLKQLKLLEVGCEDYISQSLSSSITSDTWSDDKLCSHPNLWTALPRLEVVNVVDYGIFLRPSKMHLVFGQASEDAKHTKRNTFQRLMLTYKRLNKNRIHK